MDTLFKYISKSLQNQHIDGHSHLFDYNHILTEFYQFPHNSKKIVGFADVCFNDIDMHNNHNMVECYERFITNHYDPAKHILLATADNSYDAIQIYLNHPNIIKGFGEFKCYKVYRGDEVPYGNLNWVRPVCEFNKDMRLPIYIHWCFLNDKDVDEFANLIKDYPSIPFVLCHCGMGFDKSISGDAMFAYKQCIELLKSYDNLYFDISYKALEFFSSRPKLIEAIVNKSIIGSDLSPQTFKIINDIDQHKQKIYKQINKLSRPEFTNNIYRLFSLGIRSSKLKLTPYDFIVSEYLKNIHKLPQDKQQHFVTRLNIVQPMDISKYILNVVDDVTDIIEKFNKKQYKDIVMNYVINPYITTNDPEMRKVADWLKSIKDPELLQILAVGIYADKKSIIVRNNYSAPDLDLNIKSIFNSLLKFDELKDKNGTLYINCGGYLWNLYGEELNKWRKLRKTIINSYRNLRNIYGITHILLQASNFYTKHIDNEYEEELCIVNKLLEDYRRDNYKDVSLDLLCELALCLKYSNKVYPEYNYVKAYIDNIVKDNSIVYSTKKTKDYTQNLINNEHTNALYILLQK